MSELTVQGGPAPITPMGTWEGPAINNPALAELERGKSSPDVSPDEIRRRIDALFDQATI